MESYGLWLFEIINKTIYLYLLEVNDANLSPKIVDCSLIVGGSVLAHENGSFLKKCRF